jgi:hypothetical protein
MIAKREEARRQRELEQEGENKASHPLDGVMEMVELERKRKTNPSLTWKSSIADTTSTNNTNLYAKRQKRVNSAAGSNNTIKPLFRMCVEYLVENFEHVESLGDVDSSIRRAVCDELVAQKKLSTAAFESIVADVGMEALELVDCAEVTQDVLSNALQKLLPAGLKLLSLQMAGRCFGPKAVESIVKAPSKTLFAISIGGAYLLKDQDSESLLSNTASTLSSVEFKACPLLSSQFCKALSTEFASNASGTLLELSLEDLNLKREDLLSLATTSDALRNLKSLAMKQIEAIDDKSVLAILDAVGDNLESIDLSYNHSLSDDALSGIRRCNSSGCLRSLQLAGLKNLTKVGLETLFTPNIEGLPSPPMLRKLDFAGCDFDAVNDEVVCLAAKASSMKREESGAVLETLSNMGGLVYVNISGSSCSDRTMEELAATSAHSLRELNISFCPNISDKGIGYLVSKCGPQLAELHIWGCAQITDDFLDGHSRVADNNALKVSGAWMKKSGGASVR